MHVVRIKPFSPLTDEKRGYCTSSSLTGGLVQGAPTLVLPQVLHLGLIPVLQRVLL
jgi:hypothetical protein